MRKQGDYDDIYRLAKFNIDERQTSSFIGLPTPAAALVVLSLPLILNFSGNEFATAIIQNVWFLIGLAILLCYLMNAEIPLFSLKFKDYSWKKNKIMKRRENPEYVGQMSVSVSGESILGSKILAISDIILKRYKKIFI